MKLAVQKIVLVLNQTAVALTLNTAIPANDCVFTLSEVCCFTSESYVKVGGILKALGFEEYSGLFFLVNSV